MAGHILPKKLYFTVFTILLALTGLTTYAAYVDLDTFLGSKVIPWNTIVALAIAACKASLVVLFFMHAKYSSNLTRFAAVAGLFWLAILIALTVSDYKTRNTNIPHPPQSWQSPGLH